MYGVSILKRKHNIWPAAAFLCKPVENFFKNQVALHWKANLQVVHACSLLVEMVGMDGDNTHRI